MKRIFWGATALGLAVGLVVLLAGALLGSSPSKVSAQPPPTPVYKCYQIGGPAIGVPVSIETQFGVEEEVVVGEPSLLCLPAGLNGQPIPSVPHIKCYDIVGNNPALRVTLETLFGLEPDVVIGRATRLCVPAIKTIAPDPPTGVPETVPHYECYGIHGGALGVAVNLETQFGLELDVVVGEPSALCLPALKNGEGSLSEPHLKCYKIAGPPPGPIVNLRTQFGDELDVPVQEPQEVCVPTLKSEPTPVGGVAQLPALDGSAASLAEEGGGLSTGAYAAMIAGVAGAALVLSAGVLYARRRWLK